MAEDNIFREVDEELRSERMRTLWRRFAPFVIGAAIAIVVLVAVNEGWAWYANTRSAEASEQLYSALEAAEGGDLATAQAELAAIAAGGSGGYPTLARFREAALLARQGDVQGAVAAYDGLATSLDNVRLRELALLLAANLLVDSGTVADVEARVGSIATDDNPLRRIAREQLGLARYKAGDHAGAQASFEAVINDPMAQGAVRNRVAYYLAQMLSDGAFADDPEAAPAGDGAETEPAAPAVE